MNSILLTSNINKFAGAKIAPKSFKYQAQGIEKNLNKVIGDKFTHEMSHNKPTIDKATLMKALERPKFLTKSISDFYKNFGLKK